MRLKTLFPTNVKIVFETVKGSNTTKNAFLSATLQPRRPRNIVKIFSTAQTVQPPEAVNVVQAEN